MATLHDDAVHPRPQLTRPRWVDLGGTWGFAYDDAEQGLDEGWHEREDVFTRAIRVPFPPESAASGIGDPTYHPVVWYRRAFADPRRVATERLLLHCGAVDYRATVWVDGHQVATHEGGHTPFAADITAALRGDEHLLVLRAEDRPTDLAQPRGKQDWREQAHSIWYPRTTGIWQPVWLEPVPHIYIRRLRWTSDLDVGVLRCALSLQRSGAAPLTVRMALTLRGEPVADTSCVAHDAELALEVTFRRPRITWLDGDLLWSPEQPTLLDAVITVLDGDAVVDRVESYVGLRRIGVEDGRFTLNGRPYYLRLALEQGYWPESHLAAPSAAALRRDVELAKEFGFNGLRIHQKVEDPRFLYWCDRLGLLIWGEMANAYVFSPAAVTRLVHEWTEVLARDYSHPCIGVWVPCNESWGVLDLPRDPAQRAFVQTLYSLTKALDPTRPAIANAGWEYVAGDIFSVHDYAFEGTTLRTRYGTREAVERTIRETRPHYKALALPGAQRSGEPLMLTEFGGISLRPAEQEAWHGYGTVTTHAALVDKLAELVAAVLACPDIAGFCYTQLTDTAQEKNGLATEARVPKVDPATVRGIVGGLAAAIPGDVTAQIQLSRGVISTGHGGHTPAAT